MNGFERWFAKVQFGQAKRVAMYRQLAALMRTGMSRTEAVYMVYQVASEDGKKTNDALAMIVKNVMRGMENGMSFGKALRQWVPADDVMILEATESSDNFPAHLDNYCEMLEKKSAIRATIIGGLVYPLVLVAAIYGMMFYFGQSVIPKISGLLPLEEWTGPASFLAFLGRFAENLALPIAAGFAAFVFVIVILLPRWAGAGRAAADKLPLFNIYRMYTGISFMMSVSALINGGMPAVGAVERIRPMASPYVQYRLKLMQREMLNGFNFGAALHRTGTGWPDAKMNLSIKIFAETQDLSSQLGRLSREWIDQSEEEVKATMAVLRTFAMVVVFGVIMGIVGGMYSLQDLISQKLQ